MVFGPFLFIVFIARFALFSIKDKLLGCYDDHIDAFFDRFKPSKRRRRKHAFLRALRHFVSRSGRDLIDLTIHDLNVDIKEMRAERRSKLFIETAIRWQSFRLILTMIWSAVVEPVVKIWSALRAK